MHLLVILCLDCYGEGALTHLVEMHTQRTDDFSILREAIERFGHLYHPHEGHTGARAYLMANKTGEWRMLAA